MTLSYALITTAEARLGRGMPTGTDYETLIDALVDSASQAIEDHCNNIFVIRAVTERVMWERIAGRSVIALRKYPIVSVTSIQDQDSPANSIPSTDYWVDPDAGFLVGTGGWQVPVNANGFATYWTVTYTAGRYATTAAVDAVLKTACRMTVEDVFFNGAGDSVRRKIGDLEVEYTLTLQNFGGTGQDAIALPELAKTLLGPYMSRMI